MGDMGTTGLILQVSILTLTLLIMFLAIRYIPKQPLSKHNRTPEKDRTKAQSNRHLVQGAQFLTRAHSNPNFAKLALTEAESAISLSPKHPSPLILKSLALSRLGHPGPALRALDLALSPPRVKLLSSRELREALVKRAELKLAVNMKRRVDSALEDLKEAVRLGGGGEDGEVVFCLLGRCYEWKGSKEEAKWAFEQALRVYPGCVEARQGLQRLGF